MSPRLRIRPWSVLCPACGESLVGSAVTLNEFAELAAKCNVCEYTVTLKTEGG